MNPNNEEEIESGEALADYQEEPEVEAEDAESIEVGEEEEEKSLLDWLKTETGEGTIEDYKDHTMNYDGSEGMGRIVRGLTGFLGELNLAIIDIGTGAYQKFQEMDFGGEEETEETR